MAGHTWVLTYHDCHPGQPGQKTKLYLQNNQSKKGWRHGSSGRASDRKHKALSLKKNIYIYSSEKQMVIRVKNEVGQH
jgi:hypothetical protein